MLDNKMILKILLFTLFMNFIFGLNNNELELIKNKWISYKVENNEVDGWVSMNNKLVMDFVSVNNQCIVWNLGDVNSLEELDYLVDKKKGILKLKDDENNEYKIKKVSNDELVLVNQESKTKIFFYSLENVSIKVNINEILINKKWGEKDRYLKFSDSPFLLLDEIETNFLTMTEVQDNIKVKGRWRVDNYNDIGILEIFSANYNHVFTYQIYYLDENNIKAKGFNYNGEKISIEFISLE